MSCKRIHDVLYGGLICRSWWALTEAQHWNPAMALAHELTRDNTEDSINEAASAVFDAMAKAVVNINEC